VPDAGLRGATLIAIARDAIDEARDVEGMRAWGEDWLRAFAATFVTLRLDGALRGCIGTVDPHRALGDDVAHNAWSAAYRDTRFPLVGEAERALLEVEVSLLSARCPIGAQSESEALARLRPGLDGIVLEFADARATFLPQVWESLPDPVDFLAELRRKAQLPPRFWHPDMKLSRYTVEKYVSPRSGAWDLSPRSGAWDLSPRSGAWDR
jgi:AmmeMemoRadiSam system protein A